MYGPTVFVLKEQEKKRVLKVLIGLTYGKARDLFLHYNMNIYLAMQAHVYIVVMQCIEIEKEDVIKKVTYGKLFKELYWGNNNQ